MRIDKFSLLSPLFVLRHMFIISFIACFVIGSIGMTPAAAQVKAPVQPAQAQAQASRAKVAKPAQRSIPGADAEFVFSAIEVEGNKKIEKEALTLKLGFKAGDKITQKNIRSAIQGLFSLGYFADIQFHRRQSASGDVLQIVVTEKPSIVEIKFEGNSEFKEEELIEAASVKKYEIINLAKVREAQDKIQKMYEDKGFYLARVVADIEDVQAEQTVKITFRIDENEKVKVKKITFIGNKALSQEELKTRMQTAEGGFFSPIFGTGAFKQETFDRDVTILTYLYYSKGYVRAKIDRPAVTITPDRKSLYITFQVEEGEQYSVGEIDFSGDMLFPKAELLETIRIDESEIFAYDVLQQDLSELTAKYGDLGYAYANVIPKSIFHDDTRKVDLVFEFDKGEKVYFGRIDIVGNTRTRDKVIRRELKIEEGALYNETGKRDSIANVQRLGFFEEVNFKTSSDPDRPQIMHIDVSVKERSTGQIQLAAGYGSNQGLNFQGSVQQPNFLGKGQNLGVSIELSERYSRYDLSFTEPYWNDTDWSVGGRLFKTTNTGREDFNEDKLGGSIFLGHPVADKLRANVSFGVTETKLTKTTRKIKNPADPNGELIDQDITDPEIFPLETANGQSRTLGLSLDYDTRNDRIRPSSGIYSRASYSHTAFGGDINYFRAGADFRYFKNIFWDVVWRNNLTYAKVGAIGDKDVPFNERLLLGGPYSLRGYQYSHVGKKKYSQLKFDQIKAADPSIPDDVARERSFKFFGGTQQAVVQSELQMPLIREADMFFVVFYDVGIAEDDFTADEIYSDVGMGIRWFSPIGPLRFEWGFPSKRDPIYNPDPTRFDFTIGAPF